VGLFCVQGQLNKYPASSKNYSWKYIFLWNYSSRPKKTAIRECFNDFKPSTMKKTSKHHRQSDVCM
jgi:hypothetical protein